MTWTRSRKSSDQTDYEHRWLLNPTTGEVGLRTSDTGIDGKTPAVLQELDDDSRRRGIPELMQTWHAFRNAQARRRAVEWLADNSLIDFDAATRHIAENSYPEIPWETQAWRIREATAGTAWASLAAKTPTHGPAATISSGDLPGASRARANQVVELSRPRVTLYRTFEPILRVVTDASTGRRPS